jgi:hypothetical protein
MKDITLIAGGIEKVETRLGDKSIKIVFVTQEITDRDKLGHIMQMNGKYGYVAFSEVEIEQEDLNIPDEPIEIETDKPMHVRKHNVMFRYWEQRVNKTQFPDFRTWYRFTMEKEIELYKSKLS